MTYPETLRFCAERGLAATVAQAARRARVKPSEYLRRAARAAVERDGLDLPPLDEADAPQRRPVPDSRMAA